MSGNIGLVSISFRNKSCEEIVSLCKKAGLGYIEWGGDIHVVPNDFENARRVALLTKEAGLFVSCYGSYFRLGVNPVSELCDICKTAKILGAPTVRIWAYDRGYGDCDKETVERIEREACEAFEIAKEYGIKLNFEYHRHSLTWDIDGALRLFSVCPSESLAVHWQPNPEINAEENLAALEKLPQLDIVHVFAWTSEKCENVRHPLYNHHITWREYITAALRKNPECVFALEFFKGDSEEQAIEDAKVLSEILMN